MPIKKIRFLNRPRADAIRNALIAFTPQEVCAAIRYYSCNKWNKKNCLYKSFDAFLDVQNLTGWVERALEEQEKEGARKPLPPQVRAVVTPVAKSISLPPTDAEKGRKIFLSLDKVAQNGRLLQATRALKDSGFRSPSYEDARRHAELTLAKENP